ncbi:MAG: hypoxanthine phosphoribosyltransferase [Eubacteriales bacterium]|jgi:hypoxanthine phosphoribosyltransferase|nr:hypoxanthine phosphoribosyltransferase [Eubacteriales bacterium]MDD3197794.1 hypoxanthine phosphoribosyltransferase [Eubacteriales bacterium]MDD3503616.1 hypoxanthine phosphoribosyltransferase [Eubacteriales bacterium]MDD4682661.1 hypoxanthine phosphoribosyltransferase [Eubacteriales bacterium]
MAKYIKDVLITRDEIDKMCQRLGAQISKDYEGKEVILICVLKGAYAFMADLARYITVPLRVDFMSVSSYGSGTRTSGVVRITKDLDSDITGKHIIVVEDIVDSGLTLKHLKELLTTRNPASIALCTAFDKPERRRVEVDVDYVGMEIPDEFIVGYGLDFDGKYRNLPDVSILGDDRDQRENGQGGN